MPEPGLGAHPCRGWLARHYIEERGRDVGVPVGVPCGGGDGGGVGGHECEAKGSPLGHIVLVCDGASGAPDLERTMACRLQAAFDVWKQRQLKYGSANIARRGPAGIMVRLDDKLARLDRTFAGLDTGPTADETVGDTCVDVANYALMAWVAHDGLWPGWPHP